MRAMTRQVTGVTEKPAKPRSYTVSITKPGYIHLDQRLVKRFGIRKGIRVGLEWEGKDKLTIDFIRNFDLELDRGTVPIVSTPTSTYIEASLPESVLRAYADSRYSMQYVLSDGNADEFVVSLAERLPD
jgi:hypothetical protein